ncbi:MAG: VapE domain-containing protein [Deltaproteobacteria bacterium]
MKLTIATANSRRDKLWKNKEVTWEEFLARAGSTTRTSESVAEYKKLVKAKQDDIKDVGGFVGGKLREGKRRTGYVEFRSMLTLDMDYASHNVWEHINMFFSFACCIYSTHKHTPEKPRLRLIIPLARNVTADEYIAVARKIAFEIGIEQFDDTTYEPTRLMYWASTSSDGEFVFEKQDGVWLDPDKVLTSYKDWKDTSAWPVSSRQTAIVKRTIARQADPLEKAGIVGAFCRAYTVQDAIEKFLTEIYKPSVMPGRYDYIPADSTAGVLIYDDKFAYSHHATDPACGKLCNAFDLVRIHQFRDLDMREDEDTAPSKLPSYKAMQELASADEGVKKQLAIERSARANADFTKEYDENWQTGLELLKSGEIKDSLSNIILILRHDTNLQGIAYNLHSNSIDVKGELPWRQVKRGWSDSDIAGAKAYLDNVYHIWSPGKFKDALTAVASERAYHPIKEDFESLPEWDGVERVDTLLIDYLGADDNSYTRAVMRKTLCAAVARIYEPGIKFDCILVLNGPQGIGKSTFFSKLGGRWFSDSLTISDMRDKTAPEKLQGYLILELGELAGLKKMDVETVKSFVSRNDDKYRPSYGTTVESHPRQCVIVGSTNSDGGFLRDITGNRRFWPVRVSGKGAQKAWELTEVDQIWAETIVKYRAGEELFLKGADAQMAYSEQAEAMEADDREGLVREYLDKLLPENWRCMDLYERRSFLGSGEFGTSVVGTVKRERVCTMEIWCECFGKEAVNLKKGDAYELNTIMARIEGWKKYDGNKLGNFRFPFYGIQRAYVRE